MAALAREAIAHKYHRSAEGGVKQKLEEILIIEKKKAVQRIPYYISLSKAYPGKFLLGYMPRNKPRIEMVSITPDGFRYRNRVHGTLNGLFRWFKEHFRDPIPGMINKNTSMRRYGFLLVFATLTRERSIQRSKIKSVSSCAPVITSIYKLQPCGYIIFYLYLIYSNI